MKGKSRAVKIEGALANVPFAKKTMVVPKGKDMVLDVLENNNVRNNYAASLNSSEADMALINAVPVMEPYDY